MFRLAGGALFVLAGGFSVAFLPALSLLSAIPPICYHHDEFLDLRVARIRSVSSCPVFLQWGRLHSLFFRRF
jgi:hypothetical protein